jgi:fatty acid desaturase
MTEVPKSVPSWFTCDLPRSEFKTFLGRSDGPAFLYFGLWILFLVASGVFAVWLFPSVWSIPAFLLYGIIYTGNNPRWHECSHGTPFKTDWLNSFFYWFCGSMELRDMTDFRWSHSRHHSYTIMSGVDPEIPATRPPNLAAFWLDFFYLWNGPLALRNLVMHALGRVSPKCAAYVPEDEYKNLYRDARLVLLPHLVAVALAVYFRSWIPVLLWGLPRFYGGFIIWIFIILQHAGLVFDVPDHRRTTRSFTLPMPSSFLFLNMENHIEHHLYPLVPFHALPALHRRVADELPVPYQGLLKPLAELVPVLYRQCQDPGIYIDRPLPQSPVQGAEE